MSLHTNLELSIKFSPVETPWETPTWTKPPGTNPIVKTSPVQNPEVGDA